MVLTRTILRKLKRIGLEAWLSHRKCLPNMHRALGSSLTITTNRLVKKCLRGGLEQTK